jgi:lysophospholipase L1-like esterase
MPLRTLSTLSLALAVGLGMAQPRAYVALGDSLGWGYQPDNLARSAGDKGYVRQTADWLGVQNAGQRPALTNLSVPGETSASFFNTSEFGAFLNSNYPLFGRRSQAQTFLDRVAGHESAGRVVATVTLDIGGNDLLDLLDADFLALPFDQQQALADQAVAAAAPNVRNILSLVRGRVPAAKVVLLGIYNPYGAFPGSAEDRIGRYAIPRLNSMLVGEAKRARAAYAGCYQAFVGNELAFTWIGDGDIHCRDAGYAAMADATVARLVSPLPLAVAAP